MSGSKHSPSSHGRPPLSRDRLAEIANLLEQQASGAEGTLNWETVAAVGEELAQGARAHLEAGPHRSL